MGSVSPSLHGQPRTASSRLRAFAMTGFSWTPIPGPPSRTVRQGDCATPANIRRCALSCIASGPTRRRLIGCTRQGTDRWRSVEATAVGGFVLGALALGVGAILLFGGTRLFTTNLRVVVFFQDSVAGLAVGAPVTLRGVKVGTVRSMRVHLKLPELIPVILVLPRDRARHGLLDQRLPPKRRKKPMWSARSRPDYERNCLDAEPRHRLIERQS